MDRKGAIMQQIFLIPIGEADIDMLAKTIPSINEFLNNNVNAHISKILPLTADFNIAVIEF